MTCIAIDDEPIALKIISRYCDQVPAINLLGTYTDPLEGMAYIRSLQPQLLFLDIHMPDISGITLAESLKEDSLIIFTTAHRQYAVEAFELNIVDYLLKPFGFDRFLAAFNKAEDRCRMLEQCKTTTAPEPTDNPSIMLRCNYQNVQVQLNHILYIEALDNYVKVVTPNKIYMPVMTLKNMQSLLPDTQFVRVHKSYIVPIAQIKSFNRESLTTDKMQIPIGRTYQKEFIRMMNELKNQP